MVIKTGARAVTPKAEPANKTVAEIKRAAASPAPEPVAPPKPEKVKIEAGVIDGLPNADYHGAKAWLGSTSLKTLSMKTPSHYKWESENHVFKDAWNIGTAAHSLILEGDTSNIEVLNFPNYLTKAAKEAKSAAIAQGKQPLLDKEWEQVQAMRDAVMAHPVASKLFTDHVPERSFFWEQDGMKFKCRPDALKPGVIVDLKTTVTANPADFGRRAFDLGYFISAAHYQNGVHALTGERLPFIFVQVEKTEPYLVSVVELDEDALDFGQMMIERGSRIYRECMESGNWPGYPAQTMTRLPDWAYWQLEELDDEPITFGKG